MSNVNKYGNWWNNTIAQNILGKKYFHDEEIEVAKKDFDEAFYMFVDRVCSIFKEKKTQEFMKKSLINGDFIPAGRALYGAGAKGKFKSTMSNCYILNNLDSDNVLDIFKTAGNMGKIFSTGGGAGLNISGLRPNGAKVNNAAKTSSGAISFMEIFNVVGEVIGVNNRRAALMLALNCDHPDIEEFLEIKQNNDKIQSANISICFTDDFINAVKNDGEFTLKFDVKSTGEHIERKIKAKDFFERFAKVQHSWCEPGAIFIDNVHKWHILSEYEDYKIDVSNPCVRGNTPILTKNGYKPIQSLVGKEIDVWNGSVWSKVTPKITGYNQDMLKVTFSNGMELECTPYHKFLMKNGKRKQAKELNVGDKLIKWELPVITDFADADLAPKEAYTMGFYCGDGTKNLKQIKLYGEKVNLLDRLYYEHASDSKAGIVTVTLNNYYEKSFVPHNFSIKQKLEWLAGLIDSDGCLNSAEGSIAISSIDKHFLQEVLLMLNTLGVQGSIGLMHDEYDKLLPLNNGTGEYGVFHCQACYQLVVSAYNVKQLAKLGIETFRVAIKADHNRNAGRFVYVVSVESAEKADKVYCLNEPYNHTFIANGVLTGNCSEYFGNEFNSCNLASINLYNMVRNPFTDKAEVDYFKLAIVVRNAVTAMNDILDYGYETQPLDENRKCIDDWRSIGLGVFGIADMLVALGIPYGSREANNVIGEVMNEIQFYSFSQSIKEAKLHGAFGRFDYEKTIASPYVQKMLSSQSSSVGNELKESLRRYGLRNGTLLAIAPTGSISMLFSESGGVEPYYQVSYERTTHQLEKENKTFHISMLAVDHLLKHHNLDKENLTAEQIKEKFPFVVDTYDIDPIDRVKMQAVMQKYVDNAISSTVNLKESATWKDIYNLYLEAWEQGCKGITVFRDNCERISILGKDHGNSTAKTKGIVTQQPREESLYKSTPKKLNYVIPQKRGNTTKALWGKTFLYHTACVPKFYVTVNVKDGEIFEVFVAADSGCQANIATITRLTSLALRSGIAIEEILKNLESAVCPACTMLKHKGDKTVNKSCASCVASAIRDMQKALEQDKDVPVGCHYELPITCKEEVKVEKKEMMECPECHEKTLIPDGKCAYCNNCGFSKC